MAQRSKYGVTPPYFGHRKRAVIDPSAPAKTKRHLRVSFYFVVKAEGLEPRNSKVLALLTVNSPVDCLRIELITKPLPNKYQMVQQFDHFCPMWSIVIF